MMGLKEHEKFWAFIALLLAVVALTLPALLGELDPERISLADKTIAGLIAVLGMAAGLLFRHSKAENDTAAAAKTLAEKAPPPTGEARENIEEDREDREELPDYAR